MSAELRLFDALKRIASYDSPDRLSIVCRKRYGLEPDEAIEAAYENVLQEAKNAIKGMRRPVAKAPRPDAPTSQIKNLDRIGLRHCGHPDHPGCEDCTPPTIRTYCEDCGKCVSDEPDGIHTCSPQYGKPAPREDGHG